MRKYLAEALGTFVLVFAGCGAIVVNEIEVGSIGHIGISAVFGLVIMAMIYSYGDASGAHFNPAVTIAFFVAKKIKIIESAFYIVSQLIGGLVAAYVLKYMFPSYITLGVTSPSGSLVQSFFMEIILTFILMTVILQVSHGHKEKGVIAAMAIGATVFLGAAVGGPISGASMNPARSLAPAIATGNLNNIWLYIVSPLLGALLALPFFKIIQLRDYK